MKRFKIIAFNIFLIILILFFVEATSFFSVIYQLKDDIISHNFTKNINNWFSTKNFYYGEENKPYRKISYKKTNKRPIVLFGCSYTYGTMLKDNETFSQQLSDYTNRTVYNRGVQSRGTSSMLWQLEKDEITKEIPDAEYFIYVFIYDHIRRNYLHVPNILFNEFAKKYELSGDNKLKLNNLNNLGMIFNSFYTVRLFNNFYAEKQLQNNNMKLLNAILQESQSQIQKKYKNAKFIMLVYNDEANYDTNGRIIIAEDENLNKICKANNIKIIYTDTMNCGKDILERKYIATDGWHPTKEAWKKIIPELVKKLNL